MGEVGTKTWIALRRVAMLVDFFWDDGDEGLGLAVFQLIGGLQN